MPSTRGKWILIGLLAMGPVSLWAGSVNSVNLGVNGGIAVPADYDGDSKADPALYVESDGMWFVALSASGYSVASIPLGGLGATAVSGDFDNDGKADPAVFQESTGLWYARLSSTDYQLVSFASGQIGVLPAPADYTGNGTTELAVYNPVSGDWYALMDEPIAISNLTLTGTFRGGRNYRTADGKFSVVQLNGTFRQMGQQYGALLGENMRGMYQEIIRQYVTNHITDSAASLTAYCTNLYQLYPQRFQDMAQGITDTTSLTWEEQAVINGFFEYLLAYFCGPLAQDSRAHCSGMAVWGDYTGNGPLVLGRDFDFAYFFRAFAPYLTLVIMNPTDGSHSVAMLTYAGQIGAIQAFNSAGLVLENNDGSTCGDTNRCFISRTSFMVKDIELALEYTTLTGLGSAMNSLRLGYPLVFNLASPERAVCYEMATYDVKSRGGEHDGILVGVNHFVSPGWPPSPAPYHATLVDSMNRHSNLVARAEQYKGAIDARRMMAIFDTTVPEGGPTPPDTNIYRFVIVPGTLTLWFKAAEYSDWEGIDLSKLFAP